MTITVQSHNAEADAKVNQPTESTADTPQEKTSSAPESSDSTPEQKEASASDTEATEAVESESESEITEHEEAEAESESESDAESEGSKDEGKKKGKQGFKRRISRLTQEREFWKAEALKREASATRAPSEPEKTDPKAATANDGKPDPSKFETHAEYVDALTDWKVDQKLAKRDEAARKQSFEAEQAKRAKSYLDRKAEFAKATPDFEDVIAEAEADGLRVSMTVQQVILESENGPALAYELAKNVAEANRIAMLPPIAAARELGKIESRIASKASEGKQNTTQETKRVSSAPKPIAPITSGKTSAPPKNLDEAAKDSYAAYKKLRTEQLKKARRQA